MKKLSSEISEGIPMRISKEEIPEKDSNAFVEEILVKFLARVHKDISKEPLKECDAGVLEAISKRIDRGISK